MAFEAPIRPTCILLTGVLLLSTHVSITAQDAATNPLISDLGSPDYQVRISAERELLDLGASSIPLLSSATRANDPHVRLTAQRLIQQIRREVTRTRVMDFLSRKSTALDGWKLFTKVVGESESARELYGNMYLRFPTVLQNLSQENQTTTTERLWESYKLATEDLIAKRYQSPRSTSPTATALFVGHSFLHLLADSPDQEATVSGELGSKEIRNYLVAILRAINDPKIVLLNKSGAHFAELKILLMRFVEAVPQPLSEPELLAQLVQAIRCYEIKTNTELLFEIAESTKFPNSLRTAALECIGVIGSQDELPRVVDFFNDETVVTRFLVRGPYTATNLEASWQSANSCSQTLGDIALMAASKIAKIPSEKFEFDVLANQSADQYQYGFRSAEKRQQAQGRLKAILAQQKE